MQSYTLVALVFGVIGVLLTTSVSAYYISCPPNDVSEATPSLRHLCYAIEQAISENAIQDEPPYRRVVERNVNPNTKRQDVDHVFLRFGRRFSL